MAAAAHDLPVDLLYSAPFPAIYCRPPHEKLADFLRGELLPTGFFLVGVPLFCGDAALLMGYRWIYLSKPGILNTTIE